MARIIDFPQGLTFHTDSTKSGFLKDLKKIFRILNIDYFDNCCDGTLPLFQTFNKAAVDKRVAVATNVTQTLTAGPFSNGLFTSTSAAAVALTLPTASAIATELGAIRGTTFQFIVDNSVGSNIVTVTVNTGITAITPVITGSATLTVAAGTVGKFELYFLTTTTAKLIRVY